MAWPIRKDKQERKHERSCKRREKTSHSTVRTLVRGRETPLHRSDRIFIIGFEFFVKRMLGGDVLAAFSPSGRALFAPDFVFTNAPRRASL